MEYGTLNDFLDMGDFGKFTNRSAIWRIGIEGS